MAKSVSKKNVKKTAGNKSSQQVVWAPGMPLAKINYILMVIGLLIIMVGFILLSGGGTEEPSEFSRAIFDTRRLWVAPITLVFGFLLEIFAIMYRPKKGKEENQEESLTIE